MHKLSASLAGKPVLDHVLDAVVASGLAHHVVGPDASRPGMGDSIAAAVRRTAHAGGWLILPGDLPLVQPATLRRVALALHGECRAAQPSYRGERGHPVGFSAECRDALMGLEGSSGAAPVLRGLRAAGQVADFEVDDVGVVTDIDTLEALARAERLLLNRG